MMEQFSLKKKKKLGWGLLQALFNGNLPGDIALDRQHCISFALDLTNAPHN